MEQYQNEHEVNEKSIYLVHLDNTRIVILVSLMLCIITVSFLIGTKFSSSVSGTAFDDVNSAKAAIPSEFDSTSDNDDIDKLLNENSDADSVLNDADPDLTAAETKTPSTEDIVPTNPDKTVITKKAPVKKATKPVAKKTAPKKKKEVVAVSAPSPKKVSKPVVVKKSGFSVQVASFDSYNKAAEASASVNQLNYQSYVDKALVNGKYFYRVKIGPLKSKQNAFTVMNNLQQYPKYNDSFIVFDK